MPVMNVSDHVRNFIGQHLPWGDITMREYILGRPGNLGRSRAGVLGAVALVTALVSSVALARPAEAQLSCPDPDAQCLIKAIKEANDKGQGQRTTISLGKGPYTLSYAWAQDNKAADEPTALPSITGWVSIQGGGWCHLHRAAMSDKK
jgi:hypothetical protein